MSKTDPVFESSALVSALENIERARTGPQATFYRLLSQLEACRQSLQQWQDFDQHMHQRIGAELIPLQNQLYREQKRMALRLAQLLDDPDSVFTSEQQRCVLEVVGKLCQNLLRHGPDEPLQGLYERCYPPSERSEKHKQWQESKRNIEQEFGVDLSQVEDLDVEDLRRLAEVLVALKQDAAEAEAARQSAQADPVYKAKAEAQQAKAEAANQKISQSLREIYRKLVRVFHPDRETDPSLQRHRTEQMQRANQAYEAGDLLGLLNLQIEAEQLDSDNLAALSGADLGLYNRLLRKQISELKDDIEHISCRLSAASQAHRVLKPAQIEQRFEADLIWIQNHLTAVGKDLRQVQKLGRAPDQHFALMLVHYLPRDSEEDALFFVDLLAAFTPNSTPKSRANTGRKGRKNGS